VRIEAAMPGRIIDGAISDGANMGAAMAFAAADSVMRYFELSGDSIDNVDYIVTGDLGQVGSDILRDILSKKMPKAERRHTDCGLLLYDLDKQDAHSGASGCGTSASVLSSYFIPSLLSGEINSIIFSSTGALMSPSGLLQGETILGVAPVIKISASQF
jgi:stage V sporulation protein AD